MSSQKCSTPDNDTDSGKKSDPNYSGKNSDPDQTESYTSEEEIDYNSKGNLKQHIRG